jgi:succinyl-diaminopimelate desuccinylase
VGKDVHKMVDRPVDGQSHADLIAQMRQEFETYLDKITDFSLKVLSIEATNARMGGPGEAARAMFIQKFLQGEGLDVQRVDVQDPKNLARASPNLITLLHGRDSSKTLWYVVHMDTIPVGPRELWRSDPFTPLLKEGKIIARGAMDNGQSMIASIFALIKLKELSQDLPINVGVVLISDEQFGNRLGIEYLLSRGDFFSKRDLIIVPDYGNAEGTEIEIAEKNLLWLRILVKGKEVHASLPGAGLNAHSVGARLTVALEEGLHKRFPKENQIFSPESSSTFEPTKLEPNLVGVNTIPRTHAFYLDCRILPEYSPDEVLAAIDSTIREFEVQFNVRISTQVLLRDDAGSPTKEDSQVAQLLTNGIRIVRKKESRFVGIGGHTAANAFRKFGFPAVAWSTIVQLSGEANEYCLVENLLSDATVFASLPFLLP